jgi:hypothetical protein
VHDHVRLTQPPRAEAVTALYLTRLVWPAARMVGTADSEEFEGLDGGSVRVRNPALRAARRCLFEAAPAALAFDALWERVHARLPRAGGDVDRDNFADVLLHCYLDGIVEVQLRPPTLTVEASERPNATP